MAIARSLIIISWLISLSACSLLKPVEIPTTKRYVVSQISTHLKVFHKVYPESMMVLSPIANPGYERRNITYMKTPFQIQHYGRHQWIASPSEMVRSVLANTLRKSKRFFTVIEQPQHAMTNFRLASRIMKFQQELFANTPRVRVVLQVDLINNQDSKVVASKLFEVVQEVETNAPYDAVVAINASMAELAQYVGEFVIHYV